MIEIATGVVAQVENHTLHTLLFEFLDSLHKLLVRVAREGGELDEACAGGEHKGGINTINRYLVADNLNIDQLISHSTTNTNIDLCATLAAQEFHHRVLRELYASHRLAVDSHNPIARHNASLVTRATRYHVEYHDSIGCHIEHHTNTVELAFEVFVYI